MTSNETKVPLLLPAACDPKTTAAQLDMLWESGMISGEVAGDIRPPSADATKAILKKGNVQTLKALLVASGDAEFLRQAVFSAADARLLAGNFRASEEVIKEMAERWPDSGLDERASISGLLAFSDAATSNAAATASALVRNNVGGAILDLLQGSDEELLDDFEEQVAAALIKEMSAGGNTLCSFVLNELAPDSAASAALAGELARNSDTVLDYRTLPFIERMVDRGELKPEDVVARMDASGMAASVYSGSSNAAKVLTQSQAEAARHANADRASARAQPAMLAAEGLSAEASRCALSASWAFNAKEVREFLVTADFETLSDWAAGDFASQRPIPGEVTEVLLQLDTQHRNEVVAELQSRGFPEFNSRIDAFLPGHRSFEPTEVAALHVQISSLLGDDTKKWEEFLENLTQDEMSIVDALVAASEAA